MDYHPLYFLALYFLCPHLMIHDLPLVLSMLAVQRSCDDLIWYCYLQSPARLETCWQPGSPV